MATRSSRRGPFPPEPPSSRPPPPRRRRAECIPPDWRGGAHGRNLTTEVAGEPGPVSPTARRRAIACMTTLSGTGALRSRTLTNAIPPELVVTVSVMARMWVESFVTSVTGPEDTGYVIAYTTGRPGRGTVNESPPLVDLIRSATPTLTESETR